MYPRISPSWGVDLSRVPVLAPGGPRGNAGPAWLATTRGVLQAKLAVGSVDDPLEQEADRVADTVLRMSDAAAGAPEAPPGPPATPSGARLSRTCASCKEDEDDQGGQGAASRGAGDRRRVGRG